MHGMPWSMAMTSMNCLKGMVAALVVVCLQGCDSGKEAPEGASTSNVTAPSRPSPNVQDPSRVTITPTDRMMAIGPDLRMEVGKAVGCMMSETGRPVTSAMIAKAEADVRLNGRKAPTCRSRGFRAPPLGGAPRV